MVIQISRIGSVDTERLIGRSRRVTDNNPVRVAACHQTRPSWTTTPLTKKLRESKPTRYQAVDIRCVYFSAVTTNVGISHVVHEHGHDVWVRVGC